MKARQTIMSSVKKNKVQETSHTYYSEMMESAIINKSDAGLTRKHSDQLENIIDIR